jgi:hypothetical protein
MSQNNNLVKVLQEALRQHYKNMMSQAIKKGIAKK